MLGVRGCAVVAFMAVAGVGCSSEGGPGDPPADGPPQEPGTERLVTPTMSLPPADEILHCVAFHVLTEERWVTSAKGFQNPGGHHTSLLYQTTNLREPGEVWECTEADMIGTSYLAGGNAVYDEADPYGHEGTKLPDGFGVRVPAGAQIVVQSHYVNYEDQWREVTDIMDVGFVTEAEITTPLGSLSLGTANFVIPAQGHAEADTSCTFDEETNFFDLSGHMHELGSLFTMTHVRDGVSQEIYHETNGAALETDAPAIEAFPDGGALSMQPGDELLIHCEWDNPKDYDVVFPEEMCGLQSHYWPSRGDILCAGEVSALNCGGESCLSDEVCCVNDIGAGHCSAPEACETSYTCNVDSDCSDGNWCCTMPVVGNVCLSQDSCPGRTPCPTTGECAQVSEFLPISCCEATGFCDLEANCP